MVLSVRSYHCVDLFPLVQVECLTTKAEEQELH